MLDDDRYIEPYAPDDLRVRATRVGVEHILTAYLAGRLPEEISLDYPTTTLDQVYGVIAWYLRNRNEVDEYLANWQRRALTARRAQDETAIPEPARRLRQLAQKRAAG